MVRVRVRRLVLVFLVAAAPVTGATAAPTTSVAELAPHEEVENPDGNVTVLRGPGALYESIDGSEDLASARADGRVRSPEFLAPGDLLVLQFESERVTDAYEGASGTNSTDRFFDVLESTGLNVTVIGLSHGTEQIPSKFSLNRSNVEVLHEPDADRFSVLVDTANVSVVDRRNGEPVRQTLEHREFQAVIEIPTGNESRVLAGSSRFEGVGTSLRTPMDGETIEGQRTPTVSEAATENLTLRGSTPFLPNTSLTVRASSSDGDTLATREVETYNANTSTPGFGASEFEASLPLPGVGANSTVEVVVARDGTVLTERTLLVGRQPKMVDTSARFVTTGPHEGEVAVTATLRLPEPGLFLVYVDGEPQSVAVPEHETVERTIYVDREAVDESGAVYPVTVWDRNENGVHEPDVDTLFSTTLDVGASAEDVELDAQVRVDGWPPTTGTSTRTTRAQPRTTGESTSVSATTNGRSPSSIPGFGLGVALAGVGVALLFAARNHLD